MRLGVERESEIIASVLLSGFFVFLFSGSDSLGEKFPKAHGVLHAADPSHCLEHSNRKCCLISFPENPEDPLPEVEGLSLGLTVMCSWFFMVCVFLVSGC